MGRLDGQTDGLSATLCM